MSVSTLDRRCLTETISGLLLRMDRARGTKLRWTICLDIVLEALWTLTDDHRLLLMFNQDRFGLQLSDHHHQELLVAGLNSP